MAVDTGHAPIGGLPPSPGLGRTADHENRTSATDPVGLSWLISVRWTMLLAGVGALVAGRSALEISVPFVEAAVLLAVCGVSNVLLMLRVRRGNADVSTIAGVLVCADVVLLSWLLLRSGGVLNPASVFYLVQIVVAALVLGRRWTWVITALSVAGYAALFIAPTDDLRAAQGMHPEIALHMRGMWLAFALTALVIAALVTRLAIAIERRDAALAALHERSARASRISGLATLAAGAAHELSTPLATIALAAGELERNLAGSAHASLRDDARLIRAETARCRQILDGMSAQGGEVSGETPRRTTLDTLIGVVRERFTADEWARLDVEGRGDTEVVWPIGVVARALDNVLKNALQASASGERVRLEFAVKPKQIVVSVIDRGLAMTPAQLSRAGEPFFTTKPAGSGTGLGLFVARSSVEQLGGSLVLTSLPGKGTTAVFTLPANVLERANA
jgi:two-component system, sensor histidine kinase RegB